MASQHSTPATISIPTYFQLNQLASRQNIPNTPPPVQQVIIAPAPHAGTPPAHHQNTEYEGTKNEKGQRHGFGLLRFNTTPNAYYKGNWVADKMDGHGEYVWGDGHRYVGNFKNNKQHGVGAYFWPTGGKYFGTWKKDKMHGSGTYTRCDGVIYTGHWRNDHQYGEGLKIIPERVAFGEPMKMSRICIFRECWTEDKHLMLHKEILQFPNVYHVQKEDKKFLDIDIITVDRTEDEEAQVRLKRKRDESWDGYTSTCKIEELPSPEIQRPAKKKKFSHRS